MPTWAMNASTFSRVYHRDPERHLLGHHLCHWDLEGSLHGGAKEGVIHMLLEIGSEDKVDAWVRGKQMAQKKKIMASDTAFTRYWIRAPASPANGREIV